ncbi:hypothetical protein ALP64_200805 [Pseudomonas syringae pv. actinidiae]|nr:hypothetical protein ALP64_200805 [Pseudomonas syringae pv. actinidiae]
MLCRQRTNSLLYFVYTLLGRQVGVRPKSDKLYPKVMEAIEAGRSYRWIARDLGISKNTVTEIVRRHR